MTEGEAKPPRAAAKRAPRKGSKAAAVVATEAALWTRRALWLLLAVTAARLALNALELIPVHFDEAQYWAYGHERAFGHYSKPPLVGWSILLSTNLFGDTLFGLRAFAPVAHLAVGALVFLTARRLFDARVGFWAAAVYSAAPGVNVSSLLMTTDPVMMAGWALAMYALVRVMQAPVKGPAPWGWWALVGLGVGLGMLAKYTAVAFAGGALGYALFSRDGPLRPQGAWLAAGVALAALSPNLIWNAANGFVTIAHLGESGDHGDGLSLRPLKLLEFVGAQVGVFGPVAVLALAGAVAAIRGGDWRDRLLAWLTLPLLAAMCLLALLASANANWAAPAYVAGSVLAGRWLAERNWRRGLVLHGTIGGAAVAVTLSLGVVYAAWGTELPRLADPFKKMRLGGPFCELALSAMEVEGAEALLSNDRRRLSECQFHGGLGFGDVAVFQPSDRARNHVEFRSRLRPGDRRLLLLAVESDVTAETISAHFTGATPLGAGRIRTHADRDTGYALWLVEGFEGY